MLEAKLAKKALLRVTKCMASLFRFEAYKDRNQVLERLVRGTADHAPAHDGRQHAHAPLRHRVKGLWRGTTWTFTTRSCPIRPCELKQKPFGCGPGSAAGSTGACGGRSRAQEMRLRGLLSLPRLRSFSTRPW